MKTLAVLMGLFILLSCGKETEDSAGTTSQTVFFLEAQDDVVQQLNLLEDDSVIGRIRELVEKGISSEQLFYILNNLSHSRQLAVLRFLAAGGELVVDAASSSDFYRFKEYEPELEQGEYYPDEYVGRWQIEGDWLVMVMDYKKAIGIVKVIELRFEASNWIEMGDIRIRSQSREVGNWDIYVSRNTFRTAKAR